MATERVKFLYCVETPIKALIDALSFIKDKQHWGYMFRLGVFEIRPENFKLIQNEMAARA